MDTPLSNPPPTKLVARPVEVVIKQEVIEEDQTMEENLTVGLVDIPSDNLLPVEPAAIPNKVVVQ